MKICYIWIERFRNFSNEEFNLASEYKFKYNREDNTINIEYLSKLPIDFFGENIKEVTAFVGKNGAGKSNALELICKVIKNYKSTINTNYLIIYEENGQLECRYNFDDISEPNSNFDINIEKFESQINPLKVVFFSNVFDERRNNFGKEITDVSVNNKYFRNSFYKKRETSDFLKQIKLINSSIFKNLNIDYPNKVVISTKVFSNRFNSSMEEKFYKENANIFKEFKSFIKKRLSDLKPDKRFLYSIRFGFFFEFVEHYIRDSNRYYRRDFDHEVYDKFSIKLNEFLKKQFDNRTEELSENVLHFIYDIQYSKNNEQLFPDSLNEDFEEKIKFLLKLRDLLSEIPIEYYIEGLRSNSYENFVFDYHSNKSSKLVNDFIKFFDRETFYDINWIGISSGHKAYLNLFATLFDELRYSKQQNLFLCIDEGDLYLHPKWQTEFFNKLIKILPRIYSGKIQLLLTSHSPFLLSDLPNQNITILDSINGSKNGTELSIKTFGGNLYDLYSEPFFLENKKTSDFAYNHIKNIIQNIESENKEFTKNEITKLVDIIGDEIIRFRLSKLIEKND